MKGKFDLASLSSVFKRSFAAQQQAVRQAAPRSDLEKSSLQKTTLVNGTVIASVENLSPITKVAVYVRAGPRFESSKELGASHFIRYAAGMHTKNYTIFGITRNMEYSGGSMTATATRDDIVYKMFGMREVIENNIPYLADTVTRPAFKFWQLEDYRYRMEYETARAMADPEQVLMEELHRITFRGGLSNPLYCSKHAMEHLDSDSVAAYHDRLFRNKRMVVVAVGVDHKLLVDYIDEYFESREGAGPPIVKHKFIGGESRVNFEPERDMTYVTVATEGVGSSNLKENITLSLFENILSPGIKVGASKLKEAATKAAKAPFAVTPLNVNYTDTGLFGFSLTCHASESGDLAKTIVNKMRETARTLKEEDLQAAKIQAKTAFWLNQECPDAMIDRVGLSLLNNNPVHSDEEIEKAIDSVNLKDVSTLATRIMKSKVALVSLGNLDNMCYLEDFMN